jgi:putative DNA primase/helicase
MLNPVPHYTTAALCAGLALPAAQPKGTKNPAPTLAPAKAATDIIFEGSRNSALMSLAGSLRVRGMSHDGILAALQATNQEQAQPPLPDAEVAGIAASVMRYPAGANDIDVRRSLNDIGNANRLVAMFGVDLRYVPERGTWIWWNGEQWQFDYNSIKITDCAKMAVKAIYMEALNLSDAALAAAVVKFAGASHHENRIKAMIALAAKDAAVVVRLSLLDADPMKLGVANGVIDLCTGKLIPNKPEFYITKFSAVTFESNAKCPAFLDFLHRIFQGKPDVIAYMRRIIGYCLTGRTDAQVLFFFYGIGANGKSTLLRVVELLVGTDLAKQTPPETLMAQAQGNKPTNDVARLQGVRVVLSNEVEDGSWLAEATVKQLTGGDTITARFLYREFFEFKPEFKIIIAGNHKPVIRGTDHGIWRRIQVVAFPVIIPSEERDPLLPKKLEAELSGILSWAIKGCLEWQKMGLQAPASVAEAVEDYREEMDVLGHFMADCCLLGAGHTIRAMTLYQRYSEWAKWGGFKPMTVTSFGRRLGERGVTKVRHGDGVIYTGLKLK